MHDTQPPTQSEASYTDIEQISQHLVVRKTQWVPGAHPEPWARNEPQRGHWEQFYFCRRCGAERLSKTQYSTNCPGECSTAEQSTAGES